jgi:aldose 1-epimerase
MKSMILWFVLGGMAVAGAFCGSQLQGATPPSIERGDFGTTTAGEAIGLYTLVNEKGVRLKAMEYGAIIYSLEVPDKNGVFTNVTANRPTLADYQSRSACFGAVVGRFANRIGGARFSIGDQEYQVTGNAGKNHIHGGKRGFDKVVWKGVPQKSRDRVGIRFEYLSKDGEEGYPGNVRVSVTYELNNENELKIQYSAVTDKPTPINLSNHAYWNLAGAYSGDVLRHVLTLGSDKYLAADEALVPTGEIVPVEGTPLDFRKPSVIGTRMPDIKEKQFNGGYDHCFVLNRKGQWGLAFCARLEDPSSGRTMEVYTTEPGVQLFTANFGPGAFEGPNGYSYPRHLGVCLETQHFPDSPNKPHFPSTILQPGKTFTSVTLFKFGAK